MRILAAYVGHMGTGLHQSWAMGWSPRECSILYKVDLVIFKRCTQAVVPTAFGGQLLSVGYSLRRPKGMILHMGIREGFCTSQAWAQDGCHGPQPSQDISIWGQIQNWNFQMFKEHLS